MLWKRLWMVGTLLAFGGSSSHCRGCAGNAPPAPATTTPPAVSAVVPTPDAPSPTPTAPPAPTPVQFADLASATDAEPVRYLAALTDGSVWEWTSTGTGGLQRRRIAGIAAATNVAASSEHGCALLRDGTVQCWERSEGTPPSWDRSRGRLFVVPGLANVRSISAGQGQACAVLADQTVRCWPLNGSLTGLSAASVRAPSGASNVRQFAVAFDRVALLADGTVRAWNGGGTEGAPPDTMRTIAGVTGVTEVTACGRFACARRNDGTVQCWGWDAAPQVVQGVSNAAHVACGEAFGDNENSAGTVTHHGRGTACAVTAAGELRCWDHRGNLDGLAVEPLGAPETVPAGSRIAMGSNSEDSASLCTWTAASATCGGEALSLPTPADYAAVNAAPTAPTTPPAPTAVTQPAPNNANSCGFTARNSFHLRPEEVLESTGEELAAGTSLEVLGRTTLTRGAAQMYRVRVTADGREGFMFLDGDEVPADCAAAQ